ALLYCNGIAQIRTAPMLNPAHSTRANLTVASADKHGVVKNMALDIQRNKLSAVVETETHDGILAIVENGQIRKLRENVTGINYVAVDWIGGNVLYTVEYPSTSPGIHLCKMNGLFCKRIIEGRAGVNIIQKYRGLTVNSMMGLAAWIDVKEKGHEISVANLDGTGVRLVVDNLSYASGWSIDSIQQMLYFSDVESRKVEKVDLASGKRTTVGTYFGRVYDLAFFNGQLYWTEWYSKTLKVVSVAAPYHGERVAFGAQRYRSTPYGIAMNHSLYQRHFLANPCERINCPWMCVVIPLNVSDPASAIDARCICPDEYEENEDFDSSVHGSLPCKSKHSFDSDNSGLVS
ncbi:hypothetical protein PMAYCL1PPCAC_33113, partial [Pristionchus mayeri]